MLEGIITLLYTIGAVDIIYTHETITHFKLNELGRKLLGLSSNFIEDKKNDFNCILNNKKLVISTMGNNTSKINLLKRIGKPIGNDMFLITYKEFMKECNTDSDIDYNIKGLTELFDVDVPSIWTDFISEINERLKPIYNEQELIVVNFPKDNKDFLNIILDNDNIRELFLMVEGFKGAFSSNNYKLFKKIMKDEGFFL